MSNEIHAQVEQLLTLNNVIYNAVFTGKQTRDNWPCFAWVCTFTYKNKNETFPFYMGLGHVIKAPKHSWIEDKPIKPHACNVLHSLIMDASANNEGFEDWCNNYGYDTDSRKALETYLLCQSNGVKIRAILGGKLLQQISELLQDY